jgi:hypothetical protein
LVVSWTRGPPRTPRAEHNAQPVAKSGRRCCCYVCAAVARCCTPPLPWLGCSRHRRRCLPAESAHCLTPLLPGPGCSRRRRRCLPPARHRCSSLPRAVAAQAAVSAACYAPPLLGPSCSRRLRCPRPLACLLVLRGYDAAEHQHACLHVPCHGLGAPT